MNFLETFLVGVALAMDAFAVSIALGTADGKNFNWKKIILTALFFGGFQFFMPAAGWFCGSLFSSFLQRYGRIIAFILLAFLGGKMIYERNREERAEFGLVQLTVLALATSIDALLVGVGYACLGRSGILLDAALIGTVTFFIAQGGCLIGRFIGNIFGNWCAVAGGSVLILIGVKMLLLG